MAGAGSHYHSALFWPSAGVSRSDNTYKGMGKNVGDVPAQQRELGKFFREVYVWNENVGKHPKIKVLLQIIFELMNFNLVYNPF